MKTIQASSSNPHNEDFESILSEIYPKKQPEDKKGPITKILGHPLHIIIAASTRPKENLAALGIDFVEGIQTLPPLLFHTSNVDEIYPNGVEWIMDMLPGEKLKIFIPFSTTALLDLPDSKLLHYVIPSVNDPTFEKLRKRADRQLDRYIQHLGGEVNGEILELPDFPDSSEKHAAWWAYCWKECSDAGLAEGEVYHEILSKMRLALSQADVITISRKLNAITKK